MTNTVNPKTTNHRRHITLSLLSVAAVGVVLAACGSSSTSTTKPTTPTHAAITQRQLPGTSGLIAAVTPSSLEVQSPTTGQTTVNYTASTTITQTTTTSASAITVGSCVSAFGKPTAASSSSASRVGGPVTATTVTITQPVADSCATGFSGRSPSGAVPGSSTRKFTPPTGKHPAGVGGFSGGSFAAASGSVTAVAGSTVTISETNPTTKVATAVVVTLTSTTTFTTSGQATAAALVVGQCARASGPADTTGAITAKSINVTAPTNGSCTSGFGGFRPGSQGTPPSA